VQYRSCRLAPAAEQVLGEYQQKGLFGPKGALRVDVMSFLPETSNQAPELGALWPSSTSGRVTT
jgi:hypothetical protein